MMRNRYRRELAGFAVRLVDLVEMARWEMREATTALLDDDPALAGSVGAERREVTELHHLIDEQAIALLARQQPVASDLRMIVAGLRMSADLERMGVLADHVAAVAKSAGPHPVVPPELRPTIRSMGRVADRMAQRVCSALVNRTADDADEVIGYDDEMKRLLAELYQKLLAHGGQWPNTTAMTITLVGRYYERFADHAISLAKRVTYLIGTRRYSSPDLPVAAREG